jgi:hypothetical protein
VVFKARVYTVRVAVNNVVSDAVRATSVAVDSSNVNRPIRARLSPLAAVPTTLIEICDTVVVTSGVKKTNTTCPDTRVVPLKARLVRGTVSIAVLVWFVHAVRFASSGTLLLSLASGSVPALMSDADGTK